VQQTDCSDLSGRVVVVTGGSRGIGRATALMLARIGATVGLIQRGDARETLNELEDLGARCAQARVDLSEGDYGVAALGELIEHLGGLDALVCNAGAIDRRPAIDVDIEDFRRIVDVGLISVFAQAQAAARRFIANDTAGTIVLVSSVLAFQGGIGVPAYAASKGAIANLTRSLANEWAADGIRVNAVAPGYIANDQTAPLRGDPVRYRQITERIPAGRWGTNEDVASAICALTVPALAYVNGHTLVVDGGYLGR